MKKEKQDAVIVIRLTKQQKTTWQQRAAVLGFTLTQYLKYKADENR
jgi:hypothetical protein